MNISDNSGLYVHIPFCISKCGYCDFYSSVDTSLINIFISALLDEIRLTASILNSDDCFDSVYLGGGTPSLLKPDQLSTILKTLSENFRLDNNCEVTCELNPGTLDSNQLRELHNLGINRLSIGVQSFIEIELSRLERIHTVEDSENAIIQSREAGFESIGLDLIFALPGQSFDNWNYSLNKALSFLPEHLSVYNLTFEPGTPFYDKMVKGQIVRAGEIKEVEFFNLAHRFLTDAGYIHYEISNYARTKDEFSRHNYKYWQHSPYLGFGPSAHSFWEKSRWGNVPSLHEYVSKLKNRQLPKSFQEELQKHQILTEHILLALRTYRGLSLENFENLFHEKFLDKYHGESKELIENKLAIIKDGHFRLSEKGLLICDEILSNFTIEN